MTADIRKHHVHYLVLAAMLVTAAVAFFFTASQTHLQIQVTAITCTLYVLWGMVHHRLADHLTAKIVLEYAFIALIAFLIINALITSQ